MGKRSILFLGIGGLLCGSIWLVHLVQTPDESEPTPRIITLAESDERTAFLKAQGVASPVCIATEPIKLPVSIDENYRAYADLQKAQGLTLAAHLGENAVQYTYRSDETHTRIQLLFSEDDVLLGAIRYDATDAAEMTYFLSNA